MDFVTSETAARTLNQTAGSPPPVTRTGQRPFIMIDGFNLSLEKGTGVATYARNLSFSLSELGYDVGVLYGSALASNHSPLLKEVLFYDSQSPSPGWRQRWRSLRAALAPNWNTAFEVPVTGAVVANTFASRLPHFETLWNVRDLYLKAAAHFDWLGAVNSVCLPRKPALCHWTYPVPVRVRGVPNIYTLHDLVPLRLPYTTLDKKSRYLKLLRWICRTAAHIVTVSENSKRDIVEILGVPPEKVTNTYQAVSIPDEHFHKPEEVVRREIEGTFGLKLQGYFLFFGAIEPKKNIGRMIEGYLSSGVETPLIIVGGKAWKTEQELGLLRTDKIRAQLRDGQDPGGGRIIKLDYVPFSLLISLIRAAKGVLFPSLYEGFGLPILESMLLGTPVVCSKTSSMPEIAGDAAVLVNPYRPIEIAEAIAALDRNIELRNDLRKRGRTRANLFSNEKYCQRLLSVYERFTSRQSGDGRAMTEDMDNYPSNKRVRGRRCRSLDRQS